MKMLALVAALMLSGCGTKVDPYYHLLRKAAWISGQQAEPIGTFPYCEPGTITDDSDYENVRCLPVIFET